MDINIKGKSLSGMSTQDIYIMLLSKEKRDKMNLSAQQKDLPYLTDAEVQALYKTLSFARLLLLAAQRSMGKTEYEIDQLSNDLKRLNDWIDQINKGITAAGEAGKNKDKDNPDNNSIQYSYGFNTAITEIADWAKNQNPEIKIDITMVDHEIDGRHFTTYEVSMDPDLAPGQLRNISDTLQTEVKNNSTKASKAQSDMNTFVELASAVGKKFSDAIQAIFQRI